MRSRSRTALKVGVAAAIALGLAAVPIYLARTKEPPAPAVPTPVPGIRAVHGEISFVPNVSPTFSKDAIAGLSESLVALYRRAFVHGPVAASPLPTPGPVTRMRGAMTEAAASVLEDDPGVFDAGNDISVTSGSVRFTGLVTFKGTHPVQALLKVDFTGSAIPAGRSSPEVKIHQSGKVVMKQTPTGWLLDGFDLTFAMLPVPTPSASP